MNLRKPVVIALAIVLNASVASSAEAVWPKSASDLSIFVTLLKFRIYADHCSSQVPELSPEFAVLTKNLNSRMQGISESLLASDVFRGMKDTPVPLEIIDAFKDIFNDLKHNFERRDAATICPKTLQNLGDVDDESLKFELSGALTAVQNMIRNLESRSAR
jgi:hypothetical protein